MLKTLAVPILAAPLAVGVVRTASRRYRRDTDLPRVGIRERLAAQATALRKQVRPLVTTTRLIAVGAIVAIQNGKLAAHKEVRHNAESGSARQRSQAVFGIRGVAALGLLTVHVGMFSGLLGTRAFGLVKPPSNILGAFLVGGLPALIGVFFVLPAAYLVLPLARAIIAGEPLPSPHRPFLKRLIRLLPAYYVMCLASLLVLNRGQIEGFWFFLRPFLLAQIYFPNPFTPRFVNGLEVTWTVPSMVQWYAVLPLLMVTLRKFASRGRTARERARRLLVPVPALTALGVGWLLLVKARGWDNRMVFWWPQGFAPTIALGLLLAVHLALHQVSPQDSSALLKVAAQQPWAMWSAAAVVYLINCARPFSVIGMDAIYSTSGLLVTYLCVATFGLLACTPLVAPKAKQTIVHRALEAKALVHVGKVSYGIYLWHFAVMHVVMKRRNAFSANARPLRELYATKGFWALETATVLGSVGLATLSERLVEQPFQDWADRRLAA